MKSDLESFVKYNALQLKERHLQQFINMVDVFV